MFKVVADIVIWILVRAVVAGLAIMIIALVILMIGESKNWWE